MLSKRLSLGTDAFSVMELVVAMFITSVVLLVFSNTFQGISNGIIVNRAKSAALNLTQSRIDQFRQEPYFKLYIATSTVDVPGLSPRVAADVTHFPEHTVVLNGIRFRRYVNISKVQPGPNGTYEPLPSNYPDPGQRRVQVTVTWLFKGRTYHYAQSTIIENPYKNSANAGFQGTVLGTTGSPVPGAAVFAVEDPIRIDWTDAAGSYAFNVRPGTYTLKASAPGYFPKNLLDCYVDLGNSPLSKSFTLTPRLSGTVSGTLWMNDHLVISRVVGSTVSPVGVSQEYVEVYNPTTWTWNMNGTVDLQFQRAGDATLQTIDVVPITPTLDPGHYYLFANVPTILVQGVEVIADAHWDLTSPANAAQFPYFAVDSNVIPVSSDGGGTEGAGALALVSGGRVLDRVGWAKGALSAPFAETPELPDPTGLDSGEVFERYSSTNGVSAALGPAYDTGKNAMNFFLTSSLTQPPRNTLSTATPPVAGTPAVGANVFADDGLSLLTTAVLSGPPDVASFTLNNVATGTWTVMVSSNAAFQETTVSVPVGVAVSTTLVLTLDNSFGFVAGRVMDARTQLPLSNVTVVPGGATTDVNGNYRLSLPEGMQTLTANPFPGIGGYTFASLDVGVTRGRLAFGIDFQLSRGVTLRGRATGQIGIDPLPDIPFSAIDLNTRTVMAQAQTDANGYFELNVPTGSYLIETTAGHEWGGMSTTGTYSTPGETVNLPPVAFEIVPTYFGGRLTDNGEAIQGGVLIAVNIYPGMGALPPDLPNNAGFDMTTGRSDGTYEIKSMNFDYGFLSDVNIYAWYTKNDGGTVTTVRRERLNVPATAGGRQIVDFEW